MNVLLNTEHNDKDEDNSIVDNVMHCTVTNTYSYMYVCTINFVPDIFVR